MSEVPLYGAEMTAFDAVYTVLGFGLMVEV